jgi:hypothetical protein
MKQAILITAYKNAAHLTDIINTLTYKDRFSFYIHIDSKSKIKDDEIADLKKLEAVKLVTKQYLVNWGGVNHLKAILSLASEAIKDNDIEYFHAISGQDFPVKSGKFIENYMNLNRGKEYISYFKFPYQNWPEGGYSRFEYYNLYDVFDGASPIGRRIINSLRYIQSKLNIKRKHPSLQFYGGGTWWTLSAGCLKYIFNYIDNDPSFLKMFNHSFCSEEIFFQTIILNSPFREKVANDDLRYIIWEHRNGSRPANLDDTDFDEIVKSNKLFARKFGSSVSNNLLSKIKHHIE